jgi:hypothetical protein
LPLYTGEIGHAGDVPYAATINAMATNAIAVIEACDDTLLFVRAAKPIPGTA